MQYFHNPRCSKSRAGLEFFESKGVDVSTVLYLETPPSSDELKSIGSKLGISAADLIRKKDAEKLELSIDGISEDSAIVLMVQHPSLIERPIAITDTKAVIGRPTEAFETLI